jgi:exodeoxyribonuclease VII large subunit
MEGSAPETGSAALTPDALEAMIRIAAPTGPVLVQGIANSVRPWPKDSPLWVYGQLELGGAAIAFKSSIETAPRKGEAVVMCGKLMVESIRPEQRTGRGTHSVLLIGGVVGQWTPRNDQAPLPELPDRIERVPLADTIHTHGVSSIAVLATGTAWTDIVNQLAEERIAARPRLIKANFGSASGLLADLRKLKDRDDLKAVAITRGGGQGQDAIGGSHEIIAFLHGLGVPFYSALGHAKDLFLLDKYADQCFTTPTALGATIARSVRAIQSGKDQDRKLENVEQENAKLRARLAAAINREPIQSQPPPGRNPLSASTVMIAIVVALLTWIVSRLIH